MILRCGSSIRPPFSSLDDAVAAMCLPPSDQLNEKEEDAFSVSSISGSSSEEWAGTDDEDRDWSSTDGEGEKADMAESTAAHHQLHSQSTKEKRETVDENVEDEIVQHSAKRPRTTGLKPHVFRYDEKKKHFKDNRPPKQIWIDSWPEKMERGFAWLNVYGYFSKNKGYGGYGVILRNNAAQPIIASTCFNPKGGSQLFQVLEGLLIGLKFAVKHECLALHMICNLQKAVDLLGMTSFQRAGTCSKVYGCRGKKTLGICRVCANARVVVKKASFKTLIPLIRNLIDLQAHLDGMEKDFQLSRMNRRGNVAAHYLAKMAKRNALKPTNPSTEESKEEIKPVDFPGRLKEILWKDAFGCRTQFSHQLIMFTRIPQ